MNLDLHIARVYLAEARRRRGQKFAVTLLLWAANARRRAMQEPNSATCSSGAQRQQSMAI